MKLNLMTKPMADRMYVIMREKGISSNQLCKVLNVSYNEYMLAVQGKRQFYGKWQRKIADVLEVDRKVLFQEFYL